MCIFSQSVESVSNTRIFARLKSERQFLVYEMRLVSQSDLAMILPLPTASDREDAAMFIDLSDYARFFDDMDRCFPAPRSLTFGDLAVAGTGPLAVHQVGAFDASFVPNQAAFARLDPRFRLTDGVWRQFPSYADFGFAVFQLRAGAARVHPMALSFSTRDRRALFFPTAHVHDGAVHPVADFDHSLYAQVKRAPEDWIAGSVLPRDVMNFGNVLVSDRTRGLVEKETPISRCRIKGPQQNTDTWLLNDLDAG
jgi:hypothetical protein